MAVVITRRRWTRQPTGPVDVDWSNPLTAGLVALFCASEPQLELVHRKPFTAAQSPTILDSEFGIALNSTAAGGGCWIAPEFAAGSQSDTYYDVSAPPLTVFVLGTSLGNYGPGIRRGNGSAAPAYGCGLLYGTNKGAFGVYNTSSTPGYIGPDASYFDPRAGAHAACMSIGLTGYALHSLGDLSPDRRFILHFPEERLIWSIGSGYGGNALLGKKCHSLRIASWIGREEGWLAEHTLIIGLEDPSGQVTYMAAAFPSASGKTNPNMMAAIGRNAIFTNVAVTPAGEPWWEGKDATLPDGLVDWRGNPWTPGEGAAAHPNSRFTLPARQCPSISSHWEDPEGVPISAIIFGGRRARVAPLVYQSYSWQHGVFVGAGMASETTAAQSGAIGVTRRDPMAMIPFCGYHMADYFGHWLDMGRRIAHPPAIFHVNWFRTDTSGRFLWPGFGENIRVLKWILERVHGRSKAVETPIGLIPAPGALDLDGLRLPDGAADELFRIDADAWAAEQAEQGLFFDRLNPRLPVQIRQEHTRLGERLSRYSAPVNTAEPPYAS